MFCDSFKGIKLQVWFQGVKKSFIAYTIYGMIYTIYGMIYTIYGMIYTIYGMIYTIYGMISS